MSFVIDLSKHIYDFDLKLQGSGLIKYYIIFSRSYILHNYINTIAIQLNSGLIRPCNHYDLQTVDEQNIFQ